MIGQVSPRRPNMVYRSYFIFMDGEFEILYLMIFPGNSAPGTTGAGQEAEAVRVRNNQDHTSAAFR